MPGLMDLSEVLRTLHVSCDEVRYGFASVTGAAISRSEKVLGTFLEDEGLTLIATEEYFKQEGIAHQGPFARLKIEVHTSLELVGLTGLLAAELAKREIPANLIAAYFHDHIFVPYDVRAKALEAIMELKQVDQHL
jgi:uncharacterized protein